MEPLTWTGIFGVFFNPVFGIAVFLTAFFAVSSITLGIRQSAGLLAAGKTATLSKPKLPLLGWLVGVVLFGLLIATAMVLVSPDTFDWVTNIFASNPVWLQAVGRIVFFAAIGAVLVAAIQLITEALAIRMFKVSGLIVVGLTVLFGLIGIVLPIQTTGIIGAVAYQFTSVWLALIILFAASIAFKRRLGLYGKLFDSPIGMIGFALVMFWIFTGLFGQLDLIVTHDALAQVSGMKNKVPGTPMRGAEEGEYAYYLLGGDNLARDVFSRMVEGAWVVVQIAPLATLFAFMVGITLGLPAGYFGGRLDTIISFTANLILAFPVILLFYLLVTPEIVVTGVPNFMATVLFIFPLIFAGVLINSRYHTQPKFRTPLMIGVLGVMGWIYLSLISTDGYLVNNNNYSIPALPEILDLFDVSGGILVVFVSVVFVNSPTVFRIVRGLAMDIKTRDYVAAAQTRGESAWYIMLWEILPNARGPLIVDFCLRIGYTTILLGTLGFFGLGLPPESPDWGSTINEGRKLLSIYLHPALPPALALLSLVLGLNLLADGLREESLRD